MRYSFFSKKIFKSLRKFKHFLKNFIMLKQHFTQSTVCIYIYIYIFSWVTTFFSLCCQDLDYANCISCRRVRSCPKRGVLDMTLNCILWLGSCSGALWKVEYLFIAITPRSTQSGSIYNYISYFLILEKEFSTYKMSYTFFLGFCHKERSIKSNLQ